MLVRNASKVEVSKACMINAGAVAFGVLTLGLMVRQAVLPVVVPDCVQRYNQAGVLSWRRADGRMLSPESLQARHGRLEWGVLDNIRFVKRDSAPLGVAMQVHLPKRERQSQNTTYASGAAFSWAPRWLKTANAGCLSYQVFFPKNFHFGKGGSLPSLYGGDRSHSFLAASVLDGRGAARKHPTDFSARLHWRSNGRLDAVVATAQHPGGLVLSVTGGLDKLQRGRWVKVAQEIVLNSPKKANGTLRIWVDGNLRINRTDIMFRKAGTAVITGVIGNTHYANQNMVWLPAPKTTMLELSPFFVRWH